MHNLRKILSGNRPLLVVYLSILQDNPKLDSTVQEQLHLLVENLNEYFVNEPRIFKRLKYIAEQTTDLLNVSL